MELSTGNLVGIYATEQEALRDVLEALHRGGPAAVASLALGFDPETDADPGTTIAIGAALAERARQALGEAA
jgi:hypothetical protein